MEHNLQYLEETEEMDELNDETFGCDLKDINDDWEEAHEKLAGGSFDEKLLFGGRRKCSPPPPQQNDYAHADCEDIVKSSISNFFIEDSLYDEEEEGDFSHFSKGEPQNVITAKPVAKAKKSINLDTLRPPSPSILPNDDQFMSSVWRPLSPELNHQQQQQQQQLQLQHQLQHQLEHQQLLQLQKQQQKQLQFPKPMKILTVEELEKSLNQPLPPPPQAPVPPPPPLSPQHHPQHHHHAQPERFAAPVARPPLPPIMHPQLALHPLVQQEQQRLINTIIVPVQALRIHQQPYQQQHRFDHRQFNNNHHNHSHHHQHPFNRQMPSDKFAGFMSQREKEWLVKIFRLQCKVSNPYVEDYYEVNFNVKKATSERRRALAEQQNRDANDEAIDEILENDPMIVLPEHAKLPEEQPKYIQFDNTLGKIQMLNTKCPRKLLDVNPDKPGSGDASANNSKNAFYAILAKIELLYEHLLNIEDEDKRMPILPEEVKQSRLVLREHLCQALFAGIVKPISSSLAESSGGGGTMFALIGRAVPTLKALQLEVDPAVLSVSKGALLVYRSLLLLRKEEHFVVLLCSLVQSAHCRQLIAEAEANPQLNVGNMLVKALGRIKEARNLIYITAAIDDIELILLSKFGQRFLATIFRQYNNADDKLLFIYFWKLFVQALLKKVFVYVELYQLCTEHLNQLNEL